MESNEADSQGRDLDSQERDLDSQERELESLSSDDSNQNSGYESLESNRPSSYESNESIAREEKLLGKSRICFGSTFIIYKGGGVDFKNRGLGLLKVTGHSKFLFFL